MIAIPAGQGVAAGVFKKKLQRRRFDVAVSKYHVGFTLMSAIENESPKMLEDNGFNFVWTGKFPKRNLQTK